MKTSRTVSRLMLGALCFLPVSAGISAIADSHEQTRVAFSDPPGDVAFQAHVNSAGSPAASDPSGDFAYIDILDAWVGQETNRSFQLGVRLARWEPSPASAGATGRRAVEFFFAFGGNRYSVMTPGNSSCPAFLRLWDEGPQRFRTTACAALRADPVAAVLEAEVPKQAVRDRNGAPFRLHDELREIHVRTTAYDERSWSASYSVGWNVTDRAPDVGHRGPFRSMTGPDERPGDLVLTTPEPVRASNGESTTLVYPVTLINQGDVSRQVVVSAETSEESFTVRTPARLRVAANDKTVFPVILSMNFTHRHGEVGELVVRARDAGDDAHQAALVLGVHWLEVPQPSGHHPTLWFHSAPGGAPSTLWVSPRVWMNAAEADPSPATTDEEIFPTSGFSPGVDVWSFRLEPGLRSGLALDANQTGQLRMQIRSQLPRLAAVLNATLYYNCGPSGAAVPPSCATPGAVLVAAGNSSPRTIDAGASTTFEVPMKVNVGTLPYVPGSLVHIDIVLRGGPSTTLGPYTSPRLIPKGSSLRLPLLDYHDPVGSEFQHVGTLRLASQGSQDRQVNPGETVRFPVDLEHAAQGPDTVSLSVVGTNSEWAAIEGPAERRMSSGEKTTFDVAVRAPDGAQPGERAELFLLAESKYDANVVAVLRLRATVVDPAVVDIMDEPLAVSEGSARGVAGLGVVATAFTLVVGLAYRGASNSRRPPGGARP